MHYDKQTNQILRAQFKKIFFEMNQQNEAKAQRNGYFRQSHQN